MTDPLGLLIAVAASVPDPDGTMLAFEQARRETRREKICADG